jgi:hypothetical protein
MNKLLVLTVDKILFLTYKHITKMQNGRLPRKIIFATIRVKLMVCTGCWWGSLRERDYWGDQDVDGSSGSWRGSWVLDGVGSG